jgi:hypothetical protein
MTQKFQGVYSQKIENRRSGFFSLKTLNFFLVCFMVVGGLYYVTGINDLVVKGFTLQELKVKANSLSEENRDLSIQTTSLKSFNNLSTRVANLGMVAVDNIDYIKVNSGVAMAR